MIPARVPAGVAAELHRLTAAIGEELELRGVYRADFIWDGTDLQFLEVNTLPGTSETSVLIRQARASNFPPETLFVQIVEDALADRIERSQR